MSRTPVVRTFGAIKSRSEISDRDFLCLRPEAGGSGRCRIYSRFPCVAYSTRMNRRPSVWQQGQ